MTRNRRRQLVVNKALQKRIVFATSWAPGLCLAAATLLVGVFSIRLYQEAAREDVSLPSLLPMSLIAVAFMFVATAYVLFPALQFSHRIAGSMDSIVKTLQRVRNGDINARVTLRREDYLLKIQDELNAFLDWLQQHPLEDSDSTKANQPAGCRGSSPSGVADSDAQVEDTEDADVEGAPTGR